MNNDCFDMAEPVSVGRQTTKPRKSSQPSKRQNKNLHLPENKVNERNKKKKKQIQSILISFRIKGASRPANKRTKNLWRLLTNSRTMQKFRVNNFTHSRAHTITPTIAYDTFDES